MKKFRETLNKLPLLPTIYRKFQKKYRQYNFHHVLKNNDAERVFNYIYRNNAWNGIDSISGVGSDINQTRIISKELPVLFDEYGITTILDIPCGDFHWMKDIDLSHIVYTGADIVSDLIKNNTERYERSGIHFQKLNIIKDKLPMVDLVFCRDCLVHFSYEDIFHALDNICHSQSKYFLTTTFSERKENVDILTGDWRTLNLEIAPFMLPRPFKLINEGCAEGCGMYADKALGLWRISEIREHLTSSST